MAEIDRNDRRVIFPLSPSIATNDGGDDEDEDDNDKEKHENYDENGPRDYVLLKTISRHLASKNTTRILKKLDEDDEVSGK